MKELKAGKNMIPVALWKEHCCREEHRLGKDLKTEGAVRRPLEMSKEAGQELM